MALTIAGIVALIGIPALNTTVENAQVRTAASNMNTAVSYARNEAVRQGQTMTVHAQTDGNDVDFALGWCVVPHADGDGDCEDDEVLRLFDAAPNVELTLTDVLNNRMVFDSQGVRVSVERHIIKVAPPACPAGANRARQVEVRASGRAEVRTTSC